MPKALVNEHKSGPTAFRHCGSKQTLFKGPRGGTNSVVYVRLRAMRLSIGALSPAARN